MTKVYNVLTSPEGRPLQNQTVRISLRAPGNPFTELGSEVFQRHAEDTNTTGRWEADLIPNDLYEQEGTWYHVDQRDGLKTPDAEHDFVVPPTGGPYWLRDLLIIPPDPGGSFPPVPPHKLGDHTDVDVTGAVAGEYLRFDGTFWRPAPGGGGGGGTGFQRFQDIAATVIPVPHNLGYRPAGVRLFSEDWLTELDEFAVEHQDLNNATITTGAAFRGWVTAS